MLRTLAAEAARRFGQRIAFAAVGEPPQPTGQGGPAQAGPAGGGPSAAGSHSAGGPAGEVPPTPARPAAGPAAGQAESWRLSFADLDRLSDEVAAGLAFRGVLPGDVVAIVLPTVPEFPICYLAGVKLGATVAGLDPRWPAARLDRLAELLRPAVTVAPAGLAAGPGPDGEMARVTLSRDGRTVLAGLRRAEPPPPPLPPDLTRPVMISFSSVAGQNARGAVFGVRQLEAIRAAEAGDRWGSSLGWVVLTAIPCAHYSFMTRLPALLQSGQTSVLMTSWRAARVPQLARAVRANQVTGLPAQLAELLAQPPGEPPAARPARTGLPSEPPGEPPGQQEAGGFAGAPPPGEPPGLADGGQPQPGLPPIELIVAGDATLPPGLPVALRNRFSTDVHVRYGCAEAGLGLSTCPDDPPDEAAGCIGYPAPGVTVVLRDAGGTEVTAGQTGEILLRSAACMNGYWHDQAASAAAFTSDRFVRTGDSGHLDERGRVILVGRVARQ